MLQNLQLVVGKRYETETERKRRNKPLFSVVMDEFAPFGYRNFAQILNTASGTDTGIPVLAAIPAAVARSREGLPAAFRQRPRQRC